MKIKIDPSTTKFAEKYAVYKKELGNQYKKLLYLALYLLIYCVVLRSLAYTYISTQSKSDFLLLMCVLVYGFYFFINYGAEILATVQSKKWFFRSDFVRYMKSNLKSKKIQIQ